jgi:hypothetical protein
MFCQGSHAHNNLNHFLDLHPYKQGYLKSERLRDLTLPKAPQAVVYMPTSSEERIVMESIKSKWDISTNPRSSLIAISVHKLLKLDK